MAAFDLDAALDAIHAEVTPLGIDARIKAHRLYAARPDLRADPEALADSLAAVLGRDQTEVERVAALIRRGVEAHRAPPPGAPPTTPSSPTPPSRPWPLAVFVASAVIIAVIIGMPSPDPSDAPPPDAAVMASTDAGPAPDAPDAAPAATLEPIETPGTQAIPTASRFDLVDALAWLFGALLIALGVIALARYRRRREAHIARREAEEAAAARDRRALAEAERDRPITRAPAEWAEAPDGAEESAWLLGQIFLARPGQGIDPEATADATARAAGQLRIVPRTRRVERPITVFVDYASGEHVWLGGFRRLVRFWQARHVPLRVFAFSHRPERLVDTRRRHHTLSQLARRFGDGPLLILSHRLQPGAREGEARWLDVLRAWPDRVWVDPDPRPPADRHETTAVAIQRIVASGVHHYPMTPDGLAAAARRLAGDPPGRAPHWPGLPSAVDPAVRDALTLWRAACALVPDPAWQTVERLRETLPAVRKVFGQRWHVQMLLADLARTQADGAGDSLGERGQLVVEWGDVIRAWRALDGIGDMAALDRRIAEAQTAALEASPAGADEGRAALDVALKRAFYAMRADPTPEAVAAVHAFLSTAVAEDARRMLSGFAEARGGSLDAAAQWALERALPEAVPGRVMTLGELRRGPWRGPLRWAGGLAVALLAALWLVDGGGEGEAVSGAEMWRHPAGSARVLTPEARAVAAPVSRLRLPDAGAPDGGDAGGAATPDAGADAAVGAPRVLPETENRPAMRPIRPGRFVMGSPADEVGRDDDEGQHEVVITRGFWLAETEVTEAQWQALMKSRPSDDGAAHPVSDVNWFEAVAYVNALSEAEGLEACYVVGGCRGKLGDRRCDDFDPGTQACTDVYRCERVDFRGLDCPGYRLPSEAEWEYAARAGTAGPRYDELDRIAVYSDTGDAKAPVRGKRLPNDWGLYDMIGNVSEWVQDSYEHDITQHLDATPIELGGVFRVKRGCSLNSELICRVAQRSHGYAIGVADTGLRPARTWRTFGNP